MYFYVLYLCMYARMYVFMNVCCMYKCTYVCMYVCCMYVCIYVIICVPMTCLGGFIFACFTAPPPSPPCHLRGIPPA